MSPKSILYHGVHLIFFRSFSEKAFSMGGVYLTVGGVHLVIAHSTGSSYIFLVQARRISAIQYNSFRTRVQQHFCHPSFNTPFALLCTPVLLAGALLFTSLCHLVHSHHLCFPCHVLISKANKELRMMVNVGRFANMTRTRR
jgi:hypothetical protein